MGSVDLAKSSHHRETIVQAMNIQGGESYGGRFLPIITKSPCGFEEGFSTPEGMRHLMCNVYVSHTHSLGLHSLRALSVPSSPPSLCLRVFRMDFQA